MGNYIENVLSSLGDLLTIQAEPVVETNTMDGMPIPAASTFDSQLYLFETVGLLISLEGIDPMKQTEYLQIVLEPLVKGIQTSMSQSYSPEDELFLLQLHHYIMAIGSVAKGKKEKEKKTKFCTKTFYSKKKKAFLPWLNQQKVFKNLGLQSLFKPPKLF